MKDNTSGRKKNWLILAYLFNVDGKAASQTITDRIPLLLDQGIRPVVISAPIGDRDHRFPHVRIFSLMPSGLQYELRFLLKKKKMAKPVKGLLKALVTIICLPFYLIERIVIHLDTHWSWGISAAFRGIWSVLRHRPEVIYSTAGPSSTHFAGYILHRMTGVPWVSEIHDPLVYDIEQRRWGQRYRFNNWLEKVICRHAAAVIYFTEHALASADRRHPVRGLKRVLRPGAAPPDTPGVVYRKQDTIHFGHFGSLAVTRNLGRLIEALYRLFQDHPAWQAKVVVDIYGSGLDDVSKRCLVAFPLGCRFHEHGRLEFDAGTGKSGRQQVFETMKRSDVLVILHGSGLICDEYIPSKVYEYLLTGRPILGLTSDRSELGRILLECGHSVVDPDDIGAIAKALAGFITTWRNSGLPAVSVTSPYTVEATVRQFLAIVEKIT